MKKLIITVGLPRSGKSTWTKKMDFPVINPDSIRLALHGSDYIIHAEPMVWTMAKYMVKTLFITGYDTVILDATNTTLNRRKEWISEDWKTYAKIFDTSSKECIKRAMKDKRDYLVEVIEKMSEHYEPIADDEGIKII